MISLKNDRFCHLFEKCLRMWEIWANLLLPKAFENCPKSNKSPDLVTLIMGDQKQNLKRIKAVAFGATGISSINCSFQTTTTSP